MFMYLQIDLLWVVRARLALCMCVCVGFWPRNGVLYCCLLYVRVRHTVCAVGSRAMMSDSTYGFQSRLKAVLPSLPTTQGRTVSCDGHFSFGSRRESDVQTVSHTCACFLYIPCDERLRKLFHTKVVLPHGAANAFRLSKINVWTENTSAHARATLSRYLFLFFWRSGIMKTGESSSSRRSWTGCGEKTTVC